MTDNAKKLLELLSQDKALAEKLTKMNKEELLNAAKALGIDMTEADFAPSGEELAEAELSSIAGGGKSGYCVCMLGGGGGGTEEDGKTYGCACVGYGQGGNGKYNSFDCWCAAAGFGNYLDNIDPNNYIH